MISIERPFTKIMNGKIIAPRINGKYWMYWGELFVNLAWSDNGKDWYPMLDAKGELMKVMETGQYKAGTTFAEGLVRFKNKWFLYYGTADSMVGVTISD